MVIMINLFSPSPCAMAICVVCLGMKTMKKESIFEVTFTNDSTVFIKAMDEAHARRIVERNSTQWLSAELTIEMIIKKIEKVED
jgi:hypothetical protein